MKRILSFPSTGIVLISFLLMSCFGEKYTVVTEVHDDGSLTRSIAQANGDSISYEVPAFNASQATGWAVTVDSSNEEADIIRFTKAYTSAEEANIDGHGTEYPITSTFERKYRWLFTTTRFSDSYPAGITFDGVSVTEYFTEDDLSYIKAVSIGDTILKADTARQAVIEKKFDLYLLRGFVEIFVSNSRQVMLSNGIEPRWADTLTRHKQHLIALGKPGVDINEEVLVSFLVDSLKMPVKQLSDTLEHVVPDNIFEALFDEIDHTIIMPSDISLSNSIRTTGRTARWKVAMGSVQDSVLYAESRKLNYLEIGVTIIVLAAGVVFFQRRSS